MRFLIIGGLALILGGCASQSSYQAPQPNLEIGEEYSLDAFTSDLWFGFGSRDLTDLLNTAFSHNWDLSVAKQRVRLAELNLRSQQAGNGLSASGSLGSSQSVTTRDINNRDHSESFSFSARYEVDVWGKLEAEEAQTALTIQTTQWDLDAATLSLTASIVKEYLTYLSLKERYLISEKNLRYAKESLELYELQFEAGVVSKSDLLKQQSTILSLEEKYANLTYQIEDQKRVLAILSGQKKWQENEPKKLLSDIKIPKIALNQPADLIRKRPDIKSAEAAVKSAYLSQRQADLDRYPSLSISLSLRPSDFYDLAEQWAISLAESISMTLYDGGVKSIAINKADINRTIAQTQYTSLVREALQEAQDALSGYHQNLNSYHYQQASHANLKEQTQIIQYEWEEGVSTKSDLISAQRSLYSSEESLITSKLNLLSSIVTLFQANGTSPEM
jgi:NodT family efflux transporter outer membrane factor (OMF) lipoprotein